VCFVWEGLYLLLVLLDFLLDILCLYTIMLVLNFQGFKEILISLNCYFFPGHKYYKDSDLLLFTCLEIFFKKIQRLLDLGWTILIFNGWIN
jgi:hypothetical protein